MRTIITILHDDTATGIKTIEFSNRLVKGIYIPRSDFKKLTAEAIPEILHSGVYFLIGEDENDETKVYIWQAVQLQKRLEQHIKDEKKEFWNYAIAFTNKEASLTESDINFLEKELINRAMLADRAVLENKNSGNTCLILPHRKADMIDFLDNLEILLGSFGFMFLKPFMSKKEENADQEAFYFTAKGSFATGYLTQEGFLVKKGSTWPKELVPCVIKNKDYAYRQRPKLFESGILQETDNQIIFLKDHLFKSPSWAWCVVGGSTCNGRFERKNKQGETLAKKYKK